MSCRRYALPMSRSHVKSISTCHENVVRKSELSARQVQKTIVSNYALPHSSIDFGSNRAAALRTAKHLPMVCADYHLQLRSLWVTTNQIFNLSGYLSQYIRDPYYLQVIPLMTGVVEIIKLS